MNRRAVATLTALMTAGALLVIGPTADGATKVMPGSFRGFAFDRCQTPTQQQMDTWRLTSRYSGIGIYIAGANRHCSDQPNLTSAWLAEQSRRGWRLLPLDVGLQASCNTRKLTKISADATNNYSSARAQGRREAVQTVSAARALHIARRSTLWLDLEAFDIAKTKCRDSALAFVSAWTYRLHGLHFRSGFYSSAASGIKMLDQARVQSPGTYHLPDQIWIAEWNNKATVTSSYLSNDAWMPHSRAHQFRGGHAESHGGVRMVVDSDFLDLGRGSVATREPGHCGVPVDFPNYYALRRGANNAHVAALQCVLRKHHLFHHKISGRYNGATAHAVRRFQHHHHVLHATGRADRRTWMVLLSTGARPLLKYGYANNAVRRLQRALNAAQHADLEITGVFTAPTMAAVKEYQRTRRMARTGVVTAELWKLIQQGRRG